MNPNRIRRFSPGPCPQRQRGVVLFIALIAMVVLSLAGVAILRSVNTANSVAGNIAMRQSSITPVNFAIEKGYDALFGVAPLIANRSADDLANRYYATLQPGERPNGVPAALAGAYPPSGYTFGVDTDPTNTVEVRYIIERICRLTTGGVPPQEGDIELGKNCDLLPPIEAVGGTDNEPGRIPLPPIPHYRISVRVDIPASNTVTFAQGLVR